VIPNTKFSEFSGNWNCISELSVLLCTAVPTVNCAAKIINELKNVDILSASDI
jgi:hypothetical protein